MRRFLVVLVVAVFAPATLYAQAVKGSLVGNISDSANLAIPGATVTIIDNPSVSTVTQGLRERLDLPIRALLAFLAGIVLIFILDYLDDSVRSAKDLEKMGLEVMGEIADR